MELSKCFGAQKTLNESQTSDTELHTLFNFGLTSNITMPWFFPLRILKYTICFGCHRNPKLRDFGFFNGLLNIDIFKDVTTSKTWTGFYSVDISTWSWEREIKRVWLYGDILCDIFIKGYQVVMASFCQLDTLRVSWGEETSIQELLPSYWSVITTLRHFLD